MSLKTSNKMQERKRSRRLTGKSFARCQHYANIVDLYTQCVELTRHKNGCKLPLVDESLCFSHRFCWQPRTKTNCGLFFWFRIIFFLFSKTKNNDEIRPIERQISNFDILNEFDHMEVFLNDNQIREHFFVSSVFCPSANNIHLLNDTRVVTNSIVFNRWCHVEDEKT